MASSEPYEGFPRDIPVNEPTPFVNVNATPDAFGVNVAQAIGHLGQVDESAGRELFDRAYAMQELQQHAIANAGIADVQNKQLQENLSYSLKEGKNAVDGYPEYQKNLDQIRQDGARNMPSPYAQFLFDQESRQSTFWAKRYGAEHAAQEQKRFIVGAADARIKSAQDAVSANPHDDKDIERQLQIIRDQENHKADIGGLSPEQRSYNVHHAVSEAVLGRVRALADNGDPTAKTLLDKAISDKDISGDKVEETRAYIENKLNTVGARHGASTIMSGEDGTWGTGKLDDTGILNGLKRSEGGYYGFIGPEVTDKAGNTGRALGHYGVMSYNLQGWLREAGIGPMSVQEFLADPAAQDRLAIFKFKQYQDKFGSANKAAMAWFGGPGSANADPRSLRDRNMDGTTYLRNFNGGIANGSSLEDRVAAVRTWAQQHNPGDALFSDRAVDQMELLFNQDKRIREASVFDNSQTIWGGLLNGMGPDNKIPTSVEELTSDPKIKGAWDWLAQHEPSKLRPFMEQMLQNSRGDTGWDPAGKKLGEFQTLMGMSQTDPKTFLEKTEDLSKLDLPNAAKQKLIDKRVNIFRKEDALPETSRALQILSDQIESIHLRDDKDNYAKFTGLMADAMAQYQREEGGKPMDADRIKQTGAILLRQVGGGFWSFGTTHPWFEVPNNDPGYQGWLGKARTLPESQGMSDDMLKRIYVGQQFNDQYQQLYGKNILTPKTHPGGSVKIEGQ